MRLTIDLNPLASGAGLISRSSSFGRFVVVRNSVQADHVWILRVDLSV